MLKYSIWKYHNLIFSIKHYYSIIIPQGLFIMLHRNVKKLIQTVNFHFQIFIAINVIHIFILYYYDGLVINYATSHDIVLHILLYDQNTHIICAS